MNLPTFLVLLVVALAVIGALRTLFKADRRPSCHGNCCRCHNACSASQKTTSTSLQQAKP